MTTQIDGPADGSAHTEIKFGPKPHQAVSAEVAQLMLTMWAERNPAQFGAVLAETMTGDKPRAGRGRA